MAFVTPIGASAEQMEYRLSGHMGCGPRPAGRPGEVGSGPRVIPTPTPVPTMGRQPEHVALERPQIWIGAGLRQFDIVAGAVMTEADYELARNLIRGQHPRTGRQLVVTKMRVPDRARVQGRPLLIAIDQELQHRGTPAHEAFIGKRQYETYTRLRDGVDRRPGSFTIPAAAADRLMTALDLDPDRIYGPEFVEALSHAREREPAGNRGYDITLTFPKSISVAAALATPELADGIEQCLVQATQETFQLLENYTAYGMRGWHGDGHVAAPIATHGFSGWRTVHRTSRAGDPHWHAHITIANMAKGVDGKWSTIAAGGRDLMHHLHLAGAFAEARARHLLISRYGLTFTRSDLTGRLEVTGIPDRLLQVFSKRDTEIRDRLAAVDNLRWDQATSAQRRHAADRTREPKDPDLASIPDAELRERWRAEARAAGHDPEQIMARVLRHSPTADQPGRTPGAQPASPDIRHLITALLDPDDGLTAHTKAFRRREAMARICELLPDGIDGQQRLEDLTRQLLESAQIRRMPTAPGSEHLRNADRYTTTDLLDAEERIMDVTRAGIGAGRGVVKARVADLARQVFESSAGYQLDPEQQEMYHRLVHGGYGIDAVIGVPGSGKTSVMAAARIAWEAAGLTVAGAATAALAADHLGDAAGLAKTGSLAFWLTRATYGDGLHGVDVLVIDEAAMTDTRDLAALLEHAADTGTKIVLIGDPEQLPSPGVGGAFRALHILLGGPTLTVDRRHTSALERTALELFRNRDHRAALTTWSDTGRLVATITPDEARLATVADWWSNWERHDDPFARMSRALMLAHRNDDVAELNALARMLARRAGHLVGDDVPFPLTGHRTVPFAVGDVVMLRRNAYRPPDQGPSLLNGRRGVITRVDGRGRDLDVTWQTSDGEQQTALVDADYIAAGGLEHGYGLTVHKAEGLEADHLSLLSISVDRAALYTGMSRDTINARTFQPASELTTDLTLKQWATMSPSDRQREVVALMARRLDAQHPTTTAIEELGFTPGADDRSSPEHLPRPRRSNHAATDPPQVPLPVHRPGPNTARTAPEPSPTTAARHRPDGPSDPRRTPSAPVQRDHRFSGDTIARAAELVIRQQWGSPSMLQRKLLLSTTESDALMERLHAYGIVGPREDARMREVLKAPRDLPAVLQTIAADHPAPAPSRVPAAPTPAPPAARTAITGPWLDPLGPLPSEAQARDAWVNLAASINAYRADHNVTGDHPLGARPTEPFHLAAWRELGEILDRHNQARMHRIGRQAAAANPAARARVPEAAAAAAAAAAAEQAARHAPAPVEPLQPHQRHPDDPQPGQVPGI